MSGYPTLITRAALGPTYKDERPVENPETDLGARALNLAFWQLSGVQMAAPRALLIAEWNTTSSAFDLSRQGEAWSPQSTSAPTLARSAAGKYSYTFAASYPDVDGTEVSTVLHGAQVSVLDVTDAEIEGDETIVGYARVDGLAVHVRLARYDSGVFGAYEDRRFALMVW